MIRTTLCIIKKEDLILLGLKKTGFGKGKVCGFGGKIEPGETPEAAAVRELREESGLIAQPQDLNCCGRIRYFFPTRPEWNLRIEVFNVLTWEGIPSETTEMQPVWFATGQIPYAQMWDDAATWLPPVLAGKTIAARFVYDETHERVRIANIRAIKPHPP